MLGKPYILLDIRLICSSVCLHILGKKKLAYTQTRLKNIPGKVGAAWSEAAVALYIEI